MFYKTSFGQRLDSLMSKECKPPEAIAAILGVEPPAVSRLRDGVEYPTLEELVALAGYFEVSTDFLLGLTDFPRMENGATD